MYQAIDPDVFFLHFQNSHRDHPYIGLADYAPYCHAPVERYFKSAVTDLDLLLANKPFQPRWGYAFDDLWLGKVGVAPLDGTSATVDDLALPHRLTMRLPCRKCPPCLRARQRLWASRARVELTFAPRTWFVTLTDNPQSRFTARVEAGSWDFADIRQVQSKRVTNMLHRLRKAEKTRFRYLLVQEYHKDGYPHVHMLLHEVQGCPSLTKRSIEREWPFGFSKSKLVQDLGAGQYVTKYLTKSANARVRASIKYGRSIQTEFMTELAKARRPPDLPPLASGAF